jgi:hypothetical protein
VPPQSALLLSTAIAEGRQVLEQLRRAERELRLSGPWHAHGLHELRQAIRRLEDGLTAAERLQRL